MSIGCSPARRGTHLPMKEEVGHLSFTGCTNDFFAEHKDLWSQGGEVGSAEETLQVEPERFWQRTLKLSHCFHQSAFLQKRNLHPITYSFMYWLFVARQIYALLSILGELTFWKPGKLQKNCKRFPGLEISKLDWFAVHIIYIWLSSACRWQIVNIREIGEMCSWDPFLKNMNIDCMISWKTCVWWIIWTQICWKQSLIKSIDRWKMNLSTRLSSSLIPFISPWYL